MRDAAKTKQQLIDELVTLRKRMAELEAEEVERRRTEEALREAEKKLPDVLDNSVDMIYRLNLHTGTYDYVSPSSKQQVGYSPDELVAMGVEGVIALVHPEDRQLPRADIDELAAHIVGAVRADVRPTGEYRFRHKELGYRWVSDTRSVVFDEKGAPVAIVGSLHDITDRKNAEDALRKAERESRSVLENALDVMYRLNLSTGTYDYMSPSSKSLLGYTPQECVALGVEGLSRMVHPEDFDAVVRDVEKIIGRIIGATQEEVVPTSEYRFNHKELGYRWMSDTRSIVFDEKHTPVAVVGILHDITKRKEAEGALRESEQHYAALVGNLADAVFELKGGVITWCNDRVEEIYGYPREELLGKSASFFSPIGISPREYVKEVSGALKEHGLFRGMAKSRRKDGGLVDIEYSLAQIPGKDPVELIAVARNVTDRVRAEEALRESESNFRSVLDNSRDVIHRLSLKTRTWDYMSPASKDLLGYSPDECTALGFDGMTALVHPDDLGGLKKDLERLATRTPGAGDEKGSVTTEYRFKHKELGYRWLSDTWSVVRDERNKPIAVVGTVRDITDRKQYSQRLEAMVEERTRELKDAQEQLVRKERLAVLGQLAGGVGHELRNPLGAIKNAAYFLNMALEKPEPEVKETLEIVNKEVATCERIISTLLDFARQKPPSRRKTDINRVVREALSRLTVPGNVEVVGQVDEALPELLGDPDQLGQVFENIILNAIQAMPKGGRLVIRSEAPTQGWVALSVTDTGVGISAENLKRVFEPLFTTKAKGIGLGLAVSRLLVEAHGGTIGVQSEVGKGSTFTIRLPLS